MLRSQKGFTLIEVMIVVAIIAILIMVALPSYRDYVVRTNRSAAASFLLEVANKQERYFLDSRSYAADMTTLGMTVPSEVSGNYTVTTTANNAATPPTYSVSAAPTGGQASDDACGTLTLQSTGEKQKSGSGTRCWE